MRFIGNIMVLLLLVLGAVIDWKNKVIPIWLLILAGMVACVSRFFREESGWFYLLGTIPGIIFLLVSRVTHEGIGYGDSCMILILGFYLGWRDILLFLLFSFIFAGLSSLFLLSVKRVDKKYEFPLFPFLLLGYVFVMTGNNMW